MKLKPDVLRYTEPTTEQLDFLKKNRQEIYIILDNVLDTYNIGAIFRLADAISAKKVILCGETETPPNHRIKKASVNTWQWIDWEYSADAASAISKIKDQIPKITVVAIEQDSRSIPYDSYKYETPIALVVGHETLGVSKDVLDLCDAILEIPMLGINTSLNVMVSLGIVLYEVIEKSKK